MMCSCGVPQEHEGNLLPDGKRCFNSIIFPKEKFHLPSLLGKHHCRGTRHIICPVGAYIISRVARYIMKETLRRVS